MKTVKDFDFNGKRVLLRVDFNVPINNGVIQSNDRIKASIPTIMHLLKSGAKQITIISHFGQPKDYSDNFSLKQILDELVNLLGMSVEFIPEYTQYKTGYNLPSYF